MLKTVTKSGIFLSVALLFLLPGSYLALAQEQFKAKCMSNGQEVPCEELGRQVKSFLAWGIGGFVFIIALITVATVFWIMMLVHAFSHQIENKGVWIVVLILTGIFGAIIYYFVVKRKFNQQTPPSITAT